MTSDSIDFLERTPRNDRKSISQEAYLCHSYVTSDGLCACVIADEGPIHILINSLGNVFGLVFAGYDFQHSNHF